MVHKVVDSLRRRLVVMTDFVESTRLAERIGDGEMVVWWTEQDRIARDLLIAWRGVEVERTDGFVAVFDGADDALACVEAYQDALLRSRFPLLARVVVHAGMLSLVESSMAHAAIGAKRYEADGLAKAVAARVLGIARGGQTLVTADVRYGTGAESRTWRSHGHWLAKGIDDPFEVFELRSRQASVEPPLDDAKCYRVVRTGSVWLPAREIRHNLPGERGAFVGRITALRDIESTIERGVRLVSICGMGGLGKTRLAVRFGWTHLGEFPGGVWFCDLSQVRSLEGIWSSVSQGLGFALTGDDPPGDIGRAIAGRVRCLVILDNFEQVTEHAEATIGGWLAAAPAVTILVTTREVTGIDGEELVLPPPMTTDEGSELFLRRAVAVQPTYEPSPADRQAIQQLVKGLDGLPLALELAAARTRLFSPTQLLRRLHERFDWLWSPRPRAGRQATLRAAFDWSWDLLDPDERTSMGCLSVFDGGFDLVAAESVLSTQVDVKAVASMLEALLAKSLIGQAGPGRFKWLESVREYASHRLRAEGSFPGSGAEAARNAERAHWQHYGELGEATAAGATSDVANFVVACQRASAAGEGDSAPRCVRSAWLVLRLVGPIRLGLDLAESVLRIETLSSDGRAVGHWVAASAQELLGDITAAIEHLEQGIRHAKAGQDADIAVRLLVSRGARQTADGDFEMALASLSMARELARNLGDLRLEGLCLINIGKLHDHQGKLELALLRYEDALTLARQAGDLRLEGGILGNLGGVRRHLGQLSEARTLFEQSVVIAESAGDRRWAGNGRCNLGLLCQEQGDESSARENLTKADVIAREIGHVTLGYVVACNLGILAIEQGRLSDARLFFVAAVAAAHVHKDRRAEGQFRGYLGECLARLGRLTEASDQLDQASELLRAMDDRLSFALFLCQRAVACQLTGERARAKLALGEAQAIANELRIRPESELGRSLARLSGMPSSC